MDFGGIETRIGSFGVGKRLYAQSVGQNDVCIRGSCLPLVLVLASRGFTSRSPVVLPPQQPTLKFLTRSPQVGFLDT